MGRLLALGILGALASASLVQPSLARTLASFGGTSSQEGTITGTVSTAVKGVAPVRVTIDQKVCGDELPDEAIVVDAQGRVANAVVILSGVKRAAAADATVMNEKCRFAPRVQLIAPKASVSARRWRSGGWACTAARSRATPPAAASAAGSRGAARCTPTIGSPSATPPLPITARSAARRW